MPALVPTTDGSMTPATRRSVEGLDRKRPITEALQLRVPFEVGFLCCGLMASAPDGPGDNESRFNATLDQTPGNTTDFLE